MAESTASAAKQQVQLCPTSCNLANLSTTAAACCCCQCLQRVQSYRRLFAAAVSAALSLPAIDIHISSFSCAEFTLFNSSSSSTSTADRFGQSLTNTMEATDSSAGDAASESNRMTEDTAAAAAATETAYADVSTMFTVAMPADPQQRVQIASTILLHPSSILASPLSKFFAVPVRALYAATAEVQTAYDNNVTAATAGMELPSNMLGIPSGAAAAAAATATALNSGQHATTANMRMAATSVDQQSQRQDSSLSAGAVTSVSPAQSSSKQPQLQPKQLLPKQQQQQQQQQFKQLPADGQTATPVPVSASGAAKKKSSGAGPTALDTTNAATAAVRRKDAKVTDATVDAAPAIYTPMKPPT
jgi:hypothetical protein